MSPIEPPAPSAAEDLLTRAPIKRAALPSARAIRQRGINMLFFCLLCLGMGQSLFFAVLPPVARTLGLSEMETGIIFSLSATLWIFCSPFWGRQSDKWGRKPVIAIGMMGFTASTLLVALVLMAAWTGLLTPFLLLPLLILARALFGAFGCGAMPAAQAYMADRTLRRDRTPALASLTAAFSLGNIIGPGFAAILVAFGFLTPFLAISSAALLGVGALAIALPERSRPRGARRQSEKPIRLREMGSAFLFLMLMGLILSFAQSVLVQLSAFHFMDRLALRAEDATQMVGIALMVMAMTALFAQLALIQKFALSVRSLLYGGSGAMILGFLGLAAAPDYASLVCALAFAGLGFGLLRPALMAAASLLAKAGRQGAAAGFLSGTAAFGHAINPFTGTLLYQKIPAAPFLLCAGLMALFFLIARLHPRIRRVSADIRGDSPDFPQAPLAPAAPAAKAKRG